MKVRDKELRVDVEVRAKECTTYYCYWPLRNPGVFVLGHGYRNAKKDYLCGTREIHGCPKTVLQKEARGMENTEDGNAQKA